MAETNYQEGILAEVPKRGRYLFFGLNDQEITLDALAPLKALVADGKAVVGLGASLVNLLGGDVEGLRSFPAKAANGLDIPSTPSALMCWLRGDEQGDLLHLGLEIEQALAPDFYLQQVIDSFQHGDSRDLTGYEDGTENPEGDEAVAAAIVSGVGAGVDGSSFVAVQQWVHDLDYFKSMPQTMQDDTIGRRLSDNEEFDEAPESAHVKRTAQESFEPEAFMLRRSMPWAEGVSAGLVFVAFGHSFDAFEAIMSRMMGEDDGTVDALFSFTQPVTGSYFWCPPVIEGGLDLSALNASA